MFTRDPQRQPYQLFGVDIDWNQTLIIVAIKNLIDKKHPDASTVEKDSLLSRYLGGVRDGIHPEDRTIEIASKDSHILIDLDGHIVGGGGTIKD